MEALSQLDGLVRKHFADAVAARRHLHAHPELSHHESKTAQFIASHLHALGIDVQEKVGGHGVVGTIHPTGKGASSCIALRADIDALPITEASGCDYRSQNEGVMHACGHDAHSAILLGVAAVLCELRHELPQAVKLIFQPAEEKAPSGAAAILQAGVLNDVKAIFGLHVTPEMPCGSLGFHEGSFMASADEVYLTVKGKGGHAANRPMLINPLLIASALLPELDKLNDDTKPVVLSFGSMQAAGATNVVADEVKLAGTLRCFDEALRENMKSEIQRIANEVTSKAGGSFDLQIPQGNPVLVNDVALTRSCVSLSQTLLGATNTLLVDRRMGSEDFAFYTHQLPGCFVRLGTGNTAKGISAALHTPHFNIDEEAISVGMKWMAAVALTGIHS